MKASEIKRKSKEELGKLLQDLRRKLRDLRFRASSNKLKNVRQIKEVKKDIARILTITKRVGGNPPKADSTSVRVGGNPPKADSTTVEKHD